MALRTALALCLLLLSSYFVAASPDASIIARQATPLFIPAPLPSSTSITINNTIQTGNGTMIETCILTFTPDGPNISEVENCTMAMGVADIASTIVIPSPSASSVAISVVPVPTSTTVASAGSSPIVAAVFTMPGRSLQVLPVGLCIYTGVTTITFMFVAYVTYERVQYRKAFQQRRMIEQMIISSGTAKIQ
ncbi:hypothetical protein ID866_521 [Astraeus odoratus]|nr:hypothetical protein ID866_521 [Astraeus odoratus]